MKRKWSLSLVLVLAIIFIGIWIGLFSKNEIPQVDYGVRIENQVGEFEIVECELPMIGPYAAFGEGIPPKDFIPVRGSDLTVASNTILHVTAEMEVTEGDCIPVAATAYFSSRSSAENLYHDHIQMNTFITVFKEQWVADKVGKLDFDLHCPKIAGVYRLYICHHQVKNQKAIVLAELGVTVQ